MEQKHHSPRYRIIENGSAVSIEVSDGVSAPQIISGFQSAHDALRWIESQQGRETGIYRWGEALLAKALKSAPNE
jgi:hypothetical protein